MHATTAADARSRFAIWRAVEDARDHYASIGALAVGLIASLVLIAVL